MLIPHATILVEIQNCETHMTMGDIIAVQTIGTSTSVCANPCAASLQHLQANNLDALNATMCVKKAATVVLLDDHGTQAVITDAHQAHRSLPLTPLTALVSARLYNMRDIACMSSKGQQQLLTAPAVRE